MPTASRGCFHLQTLGLALLIAVAALAATAEPALAQAPAPAPPHTIDGPSSAIVGLSGLAVARDGTGGLVYVKNVGGGAHVFVSRLAGGTFQSPEQVDTGLVAPSSQPVIAAANGGLLVIAFLNGGGLYVVERPTAGSAYTAPADLMAGGSNPAISISPVGKAYLAFTVGGALRCGYYYNGTWGVTPSLGSVTGRPAIAAAGDGIGIAAWANAGHIYTRRVDGTSPSVEVDEVDVPSLGNVSEAPAGADQPAIGTGGDSSYAAVAFREFFASGGAAQSRVLMRQLVASNYGPPIAADGLTTPGAEGAVAPDVAVDEYGEGLVSSARDTSQGVFAMRLGTHEAPGAVQQVNTLPQTSPPDPVVGSAGYHSAAVAWQQNPGTSGSPEIRVRYFEAGTFVPEQVVSSASGGPTDAASGLAVAGDIAADVAVAWVQGTGGVRSIVAAQLYQPPGGLAPVDRFQYVRSSTQQLSWTPARGTWGPLTYTVTIDGHQVAKTTGTSTPVPLPLAQGRHTWQVTAANPAGQMSSSRQATIFIDSVAPKATTMLRGKRVAGSPLHLTVHAHDPSPSSGIKTVRIKWGGGSAPQSGRSQSHTYAVAGRYKITVIVTDQAGNRTMVTLRIGIARARAGGRRGHH